VRKVIFLLASMALAVLLSSAATGSAPQMAQASPGKPNFVFILADDMRADDLKYMPKMKTLLGDKGMRFRKAYVSLAVCCPSRATIMRGQYAHNSGVWMNSQWQGYKQNGNEQDNLATRLDAAGYRTGLFGKYLNGYDGSAVPPGWDDWFALFENKNKYFDYDVNHNGTRRHFGNQERDYQTDVLRRHTKQFIDASVNRRKPFFAYVAPKAPHGPLIPAPRHRHTFDGEQAPRLPSFNEKKVSDKPPWIQSLPRLDTTQKAKINDRHEKRVETLQALDDLVEGVVNKLSQEGKLSNTYIVFTSDNGWHHGEHRIPEEKAQPYEESIHMPLLVRGPGVQRGSTTHKLTLNTDYFPTFTDLAGIQTPEYVDGRSLRPLLRGNPTTWRNAILLEQYHAKGSSVSFSGILTSGGRKYIEYEDDFRELYNLKSDPYELANSYDTTASSAGLAARLEKLKGCASASCRAGENGR
jgi:N-acetylglucosamine-6-sulfatase